MAFDRRQRVEASCGVRRAVDFGASRVGRAVRDLALKVVDRDDIIIDDADRSDAGGGKIEQQRRAEAARAYDQHAGRLQFLLPLSANFAQNEVPLVALHIFGGQCRHEASF